MVSPTDDGAVAVAAAATTALEQKELPVLSTTLNDEPPVYAGMAGQCLFQSCACKFYGGSEGACRDCQHPNLYHCVHPRREDLAARAAEIRRSQQLFTKRAAREAREAEEKRVFEERNRPQTVIVNTYPCSVAECECAKFTAPVTAVSADDSGASTEVGAAAAASPASSPSHVPRANPNEVSLPPITPGRLSVSSPTAAQPPQSHSVAAAASLLPRVCKKCKHAEFYHIKVEGDDKKKSKAAKAPAKKKK